MAQSESYSVLFSGGWACFSRPEFKVERVSYPVMTPSAARGALEAIFWRPEIRWEVRAIDVLKPIRQQSVLRNEVAEKQSPRQDDFLVEKRRQQRSSLMLRDVAYVVHADMLLEGHATDPIPKYTSQFERRLDRGQCFHRPYLGTRECAASFRLASGEEEPIEQDLFIGSMLFDIARIPDEDRQDLTFRRHAGNGSQEMGGYARPIFFQAELNAGRLEIPPQLYAQLREMEGR